METRRILLDGATGTNLYQRGMPHGVCVEEWVLSHPEEILSLQKGFAAAGSDIIYAPTFSANRVRMARYGHKDEVRDYCLRLVALSRQAAGNALIGGDMSPAGLMLAPYGETSFDEMVDVYTEQAAALDEAGVDLFALETMLSVAETRAALLACRKFGKPVFVSMTLGRQGGLYMGGTPAAALITFQALGASAFGVNCAFGPSQIAPVIRDLAAYAQIPLIAKPNAGEPNPLLPDHYDISPVMMKEAMREILDGGASIIGGCCGTTPEHIAQLRALLEEYKDVPMPKPAREEAILLANETELFVLQGDSLALSEPIRCEMDMADALLEAADTGCDVLLIEADTPEDADAFSQNAYMAKLPVCFRSSSEEALSRALFLYQGRCLVDGSSHLPEETLKALCGEYGAVLY